MNELSAIDYVPPAVVQDVVAGRAVSTLPAAPAQIEVLNASLASTGSSFDLALAIGGGALVLILGIMLVVLGSRAVRSR